MWGYQKRVVLTFTVIVLALATALALIPKKSQGLRTTGSESGGQGQSQKEPTPIQEGVMTEKQRKHSKLLKGYDDVTKGKKLHDLVAEKGDVNAGRFVPEQIVPRLTLDQYLNSLACKADMVMIGTVKDASPQIIDDGTFVFTDYQIDVGEMLKGNFTSPALLGHEITVTRSGGAVKLNGHTVRTIDYSQQTLDVGGEYLLFLRFDPSTSDYSSFSNSLGEDAFRLRGTKIAQVSSVPLPLGTGVEADVTAFMAAVRNALKGPCSN